jgi:hypothetical protein
MKKTFFSLIAVFVCVLICFAADLTGTFKGTISIQDNQLELTYKLKADGEKLSGSIFSSYGEVPLIDGKISGTDFSYKIDIGNGPMEAKGKFYGDSIVITSNFSGQEIKNTFKRVAE